MSDEEQMIMEPVKKQTRKYIQSEEALEKKYQNCMNTMMNKWEIYKKELKKGTKISCTYVIFEGVYHKR